MGKENVKSLFVDIGNTNYHFLLINGKKETKQFSADSKALKDFIGVLNDDINVYISSVNKGKLDVLLKYLAANHIQKIKYIRATDYKNRLVELHMNIPNLEFLASDLFLDIVGANPSSLIADFGTAAKYLFIDKSKTFRGGTLGLGLKSTNAALANGTDLLKEYSLEIPADFISLTTKDAINIDTIFGSANKLISLYQLLKKEYNEPDLKLIVTGSDAQIIQQAFERLGFKEYTIDNLHLFKGMLTALNLDYSI
ncbi:MAG: type III pantothenate kinase [Bacilli bacterium]|nr:type III pantothenate kinase [Bacilli bacterium]